MYCVRVVGLPSYASLAYVRRDAGHTYARIYLLHYCRRTHRRPLLFAGLCSPMRYLVYYDSDATFTMSATQYLLRVRHDIYCKSDASPMLPELAKTCQEFDIDRHSLIGPRLVETQLNGRVRYKFNITNTVCERAKDQYKCWKKGRAC